MAIFLIPTERERAKLREGEHWYWAPSHRWVHDDAQAYLDFHPGTRLDIDYEQSKQVDPSRADVGEKFSALTSRMRWHRIVPNPSGGIYVKD